MAEHVIDRDEEPRIFSASDHGVASHLAERVSIVCPVNAIRRASWAGEIEEAVPDIRNTRSLSRVIPCTASATDEVGTSTMTSTLPVSYHSRAMLEPTSGLF